MTKQSRWWPFLVINALDMVGLATVFPIFTFLILKDNIFYSPSTDHSMGSRSIILALLLAMYPGAQLFGSAIVNAISDIKGRKKVLLFTTLGSLVGNLLSALGIAFADLPLLVFSRMVSGFFAGNAVLCLAAATDCCNDAQAKEKVVSLFTLLKGIGFVAGALIGGILSDNTLVAWFSPDLPFYLTALFYLGAWAMIFWGVEDISHPSRAQQKKEFSGIEKLQQTLALAPVRHVLFADLFYMIAWYLVVQFLSVFLLKRFHFEESSTGTVYAFIGIVWFVGALVNHAWVYPRVRYWRLAIFGLPVFAVGSLFFPLMPNIILCTLLLGGMFFMDVGTNASIDLVMTEISDIESKGSALGITDSFEAFAGMTAPLIGGIILHIDEGATFYLAAFFGILSWWIYHRTPWHCTFKPHSFLHKHKDQTKVTL